MMMKTGIMSIDAKYPFTAGLYVVAGSPSSGKTAFCISTAIASSVDNTIPAMFITMEDSIADVLSRCISQMTGIPISMIRKMTLTAEQVVAFSMATEKLRASGLRFVQGALFSRYTDFLQQIEDPKNRLIVIDGFIHALRFAETESSGHLQYRGILTGLMKALANASREHGKTILLSLPFVRRYVRRAPRSTDIVGGRRAIEQISRSFLLNPFLLDCSIYIDQGGYILDSCEVGMDRSCARLVEHEDVEAK